jgi:VIT1/CCC1 family predicted Fe2+/Mn2+ transporter
MSIGINRIKEVALMGGRVGKGLALALSVAAVGVFPAVASAQSVSDAQAQTGTIQNNASGNSGTATQSGGNHQSATQSCSNNGPCVNLNQQANCVGAGCQAANVANVIQGAAPVTTAAVPVARAAVVTRVPLAFTGINVGTLYLLGGLLAAGGLALLTAQRRGWLLALRRSAL